MNRSFLKPLREKLVLPDSGYYLLGLSGGADSVALLIMLAGNGRIRFDAIHVNHGLRGAESDADEAFTDALCAKEGVRLHIYRPDLAGRNDEAAAREARYGCFQAAIAETGADGILLAHHGDDQAETFLLHLLRGAGTNGLSGMAAESRWHGIRIIRPMLSLSGKEIRQALRSCGIEWREDSSNLDTRYLRNRIRRELLPQMEAIAPGAAVRIRGAMDLIHEDRQALDALAEDLFRQALQGERLDAERLETEPKAVSCRALRKWWDKLGPCREERGLSQQQTDALTALLENRSRRANLPAGWHASRIGRYLYLTPPREDPAEPVPVRGTETRFADWCLTEFPSAGDPGDGRRCQEVPDGFTEGCVIRTRRPGDRIHPFGAQGEKKLQDYLTDRKIPQPWRDRIPLLCRGEEVLLVCGVGAGNVPEWKRGISNVRLTWIGAIPWMERE